MPWMNVLEPRVLKLAAFWSPHPSDARIRGICDNTPGKNRRTKSACGGSARVRQCLDERDDTRAVGLSTTTINERCVTCAPGSGGRGF